jgi:GTPase-associated protein 1, N-terminal domain type 2/GTPase-associated protein 1, middle domain
MLIAQFSYCSCQHDGPFDSGPGWKVAELVGVPKPTAELEDLVRQAATRVGTYRPVRAPEYAAREVIESLPSSLRLDPISGDVVCLLRSISAGQDYSRRPAAFSHGILIALRGQPMVTRPAELWDWEWLTPIDAEEIESARLDTSVPEPIRHALTPETILPFALGRPEVIRPLVAAFAQCLATDVPLVLIEEDPAVASCWFAALQYLLTPAAAWSLPFDTYQEPDAVLHRPEQGARLIAVTDLDDESVRRLVRSGRIVVPAARTIEASAATALAWSEQPYGSLQASPWAELALQLLDTGLEMIILAMSKIDELGALASDGGRTSPRWALPTALLCIDFPLSPAHRNVAAELCINLWPTTERIPAELVEHLRMRMVNSLNHPFETFRDRAEQLSRTADSADAFSDLVLGGYLTGLLDAPTASARDKPWIPPLRLLSEPAMADVLDALPALLSWTAELPITEPTVAVALMVAACLVAEAAPSERRDRAEAWLEPRIGDMLEGLIAHDRSGSEVVFAAMPPLPEFVWSRLLDPMLSAMLAEPKTVEPEPVDLSISYADGLQQNGYYRTVSGHESWRRPLPAPQLERRPRPSPRRQPEPGKRWPAAFHEWIGAAGLDQQLSGDLALLRFTPVLAEHAAYRSHNPGPLVNVDTLVGLTFWAQARTIGTGGRAQDAVLWAARDRWPDLSKMLPIAPQLLDRLGPDVDTRLLLERLLIHTPLGKADALLRTPGAHIPGQRPLVNFHRAQSRQQVITGAQFALDADARATEYMDWITQLNVADVDHNVALRSSIWLRTAAVFLCLDLRSALQIWLRSEALAYVIGRKPQPMCDFDGAWELILQSLEGSTGRDLGEVLAYLHMRSIMQVGRDPARTWLAGGEAAPELPMTTRLRTALAIADDEVSATFRDYVARWTEIAGPQDRLISASGASNAKEFHKVVNAVTARVFETPKGSKFGFNRSRS